MSWVIPWPDISKAGHDVTVYNRTKSKAEKWIKQYKGRVADTPENAAKDLILYSLALVMTMI